MSTVGILAAREYLTRLRSRGFIVGTILGVIGIVSLSFISVIGNALGDAFTTSIALVGPDAAVTTSLEKALSQDYKITVEPYRSHGPELPKALKEQVMLKKYDAALVAYREKSKTLAFAYYPVKSASLEDQQNLRRQLLQTVVASDFSGASAAFAERTVNFPFTTTDLNPRYKSAAEAGLAQGLVYFLLLLLYISVIMYGVYVAQGVIEEKSNRVMEIMIAAVRPGQLLAGKIGGIGALALTQMLMFAVAAAAMLVAVALSQASKAQSLSAAASAQGQQAMTAIATVPPSTIVYLLVFFLLGFFTYATLFAGVGALASKAEDVQQSNGILISPIILAYVLVDYRVARSGQTVFGLGFARPTHQSDVDVHSRRDVERAILADRDFDRRVAAGDLVVHPARSEVVSCRRAHVWQAARAQRDLAGASFTVIESTHDGSIATEAHDGGDHGARKAPRFYFPIKRDLWRHQRRMGLWASRRRAQAQRARSVVARHRRAPR